MSKRQIPAKQVVADIKGGMSDETLRETYRLSPRGLESLFKKLLSRNLITQVELDERHARGKAVGTEAHHEPEKPGVGPLADNEVRADAHSALQNESADAQDSLADSALVAFEGDQRGEHERNRSQHWLAVILVLTFLVSAGLCFFWIFPIRDNIDLSLWHWLTKQRNGQARISREAVPPAVQRGKEAPENEKLLSDCEEKELLFPVRPVRENESAKEVLATVLRLQVFMRNSGCVPITALSEILPRASHPNREYCSGISSFRNTAVEWTRMIWR